LVFKHNSHSHIKFTDDEDSTAEIKYLFLSKEEFIFFKNNEFSLFTGVLMPSENLSKGVKSIL